MSDMRDTLFSSIYGGGPVESGQPMWAENGTLFPRSAAPAATAYIRQCRGSGSARWVDWSRSANDTSFPRWSHELNDAKRASETRTEHGCLSRTSRRGTMKLQETALLCAVLTIVAGRRALAYSLRSPFSLLICSCSKRSDYTRICMRKSENGRNCLKFLLGATQHFSLTFLCYLTCNSRFPDIAKFQFKFLLILIKFLFPFAQQYLTYRLCLATVAFQKLRNFKMIV